jgi:hypothetical protein
MNRAKTAILVTFFTLLIWAFAEGESLQTKRTEAEVDFSTPSSETYAVRLADGEDWGGSVELIVEGAASSLDGLESVLRRALVLSPGMAGVPRESGEHTVNLREVLRAHDEFRSRGVQVLSAEPLTVRVVVDELTTVTVPIRIEAPVEELDGAPQLVGVTEAEVRLPARLAAALPAGAVIIARVRSEDLAPLQEGVGSTIQVRPEPDAAMEGARFLEISPSQVSVQLTVRSKTESITLRTVAVDLRLPSGELGKWDVQIPLEEQSLIDVRVTGPSDLIEQIEAQQLVVRAFVRLSFEELERRVSSKQAEFTDFPDALGLTFEVEDREVRFTIQARADGQGDGSEGNGAPPPG